MVVPYGLGKIFRLQNTLHEVKTCRAPVSPTHTGLECGDFDHLLFPGMGGFNILVYVKVNFYVESHVFTILCQILCYAGWRFDNFV